MSLIDALAGGLEGYLGGKGVEDAIGDLQGLSNRLEGDIRQQGQTAYDQLAFKPVTVTSGTGNVGVDRGGNINIGLNQQGQALQSGLQNQALGMIGQPSLTGGQALGPANVQGTGQGIEGLAGTYTNLAQQSAGALGGNREQELFNRLQAIQQPDLDRQRASQEARLRAQGRLGLSSSAYGASPEQFAFEKAAAEAREGNAIQAIQLADQLKGTEQQRSLALAQQAGQLGQIGSSIRGQDIQNLSARSLLPYQTEAARLANQRLSTLTPLEAQRANLANIQSSLASSFLPQQQAQALLTPAATFSQLGQTAQTAQTNAQLKSLLEAAGIQATTGANVAELTADQAAARAQAYGGLFSALAPSVISGVGAAAGAAGNFLGNIIQDFRTEDVETFIPEAGNVGFA